MAGKAINRSPVRHPILVWLLICDLSVKKTKVCFLQSVEMSRQDGEPPHCADGTPPASQVERLKGSVQGYQEPLEPVGIDDWEALGLEDDMATRGGGA